MSGAWTAAPPAERSSCGTWPRGWQAGRCDDERAAGDQVQAAVGIPLLHLGDATAQAVSRTGLATVGLLGTAFTMEQDFYRDRLTSHGLQVLVPPADDRAEVHRIICEESRQAYRDAIVRLVQAGAEGVVLGCTEIELLISDTESPVPVFPTTRLHVEAAVDASLATRSNV